MSIGKIAEFNIRTDNWALYVERLEQYFIVNKIASELKVPTLITLIGLECYEVLVDLCRPEKPSSKTFEELTSVLGKHLQPKPSILAERFKFRQRNQMSNETLVEYLADLKTLAKTCEFGTWLEESLRDQFVCGLRCNAIRNRLFQEDHLDLSKAYLVAVSMEATDRSVVAVESHAQALGGVQAETALCQAAVVQPRRPWTASGATGRLCGRSAAKAGSSRRHAAAGTLCRACGRQHGRIPCRYVNYVCRACKKLGHLERVCPNVTGDCYTGDDSEND